MSHDGLNNVPVHYVKGYPSLAAFIASDADRSTQIYRRFDRLAARNLLYLQSELAELEARQDSLDAADFRGTLEEKAGARNWETLRAKAAVGGQREQERLDLALQIRSKLSEYEESIVRRSTLLSLSSPSNRVLEALRNVFYNVDTPGGTFPTLGGHGGSYLDDKADLMVLSVPMEEDRLTRMLRHYFPVLFLAQKTHTRLAYISERRLRLAVALINIMVVAMLMFGAIYNLYYVTDNEKRLGLIAGYTVMFAACVGLLTNARRSEVFAACAAYAAVLVVFVSGNLGMRSPSVS